MRILISGTGLAFLCILTRSYTHHSGGTDGPVYTANSNHQFWENNMPTTHKENYNFVWMAGNIVIHMIEQNNDTYNYPLHLFVGGQGGMMISKTDCEHTCK